MGAAQDAAAASAASSAQGRGREGAQGGQGRAGECPDHATGMNRLLLYGFLDAYFGISGWKCPPRRRSLVRAGCR